MPTELAIAGANPRDRARVLLDCWAQGNLYCPNCSSDKLNRDNGRTGQLRCPGCRSRFEIQGQPGPFDQYIAAGPFDSVRCAMGDRRLSGRFYLHYDPRVWIVRDLLLVPGFAIPEPAMRRRGSRRHFALDQIPAQARIALVITIKSSSPGGTECLMISRPREVREKFRRLKPRKAKVAGPLPD
ncbi:MAG: DpnI domain-containing protein [Limisphaerales bacterium]